MPDRMPDMPDRILQTIPDIMPENMSEDTLVRMSEVPQRECQKECQVISQIESPPHTCHDGDHWKNVYLKDCLSQSFL